MSYYDFNNHFWSPQMVCCQSRLAKPRQKNAKSRKLVGMLSLMCVAVWTPLLVQILVPTNNQNQENISLNNNEVGSDRFLKREHYYFFYRSVQN
ncbi:hypothetical protein F7734_38865 [Scytonema sp. UIC 10036]|uniref:hypothetical protein n=1 Tax=Scytonema sp. UIC 10036 TaxID=2304196 RepID=UPI0012DAC94B|nr:hypothetical protein [Scytonema sp. UIC 10036]